jgi:hypothetical protein
VAIKPQQRVSPEVLEALRPLVLSLTAGARDHAASITQHIHDRMPEFDPGAQVTEQTVDTVAAIIAGVARMVLRGERPEDVVIPAERVEYARSFVDRGLDPAAARAGATARRHEELWRVCETIVDEQPLEGELLARLREVLSVELFGYDDVLGERMLEEYEAEGARWAPSAEKLRRETVTSILAGPAPREALQAWRRQRDALGQRRGPRAVVGGCGARPGIRVPRARAARRRR